MGKNMLLNKLKTAGQILLIPLEDIVEPTAAPRKIYTEDEIELLSESISEKGLLNPLLVRYKDNGLFEVISGERRRRAAILAGLNTVPCIILKCSEIDKYIYGIIDNLHRKELHYLESALLIEELRQFMSIEKLSATLSIPEGQILSRIRLLNLSNKAKQEIISNNINENTANLICRVGDKEKQEEIINLIGNKGLGFREAYDICFNNTKQTVFIAHYKDYKIFENTIEHATETMIASGIEATLTKNESEDEISYTVTINKMI